MVNTQEINNINVKNKLIKIKQNEKNRLIKKLIKEEIQKVLKEELHDTLKDLKAAGVNLTNRSEIEVYLNREISDEEFDELMGMGYNRNSNKSSGRSIVGMKNGQPIYSDGSTGYSNRRVSYRKRY